MSLALRSLIATLAISSFVAPVTAQPHGGFELVPVGVVGGNPPGTVISGNEIILPQGNVLVEFEIRAFWGGEPGLLMASAQCKIDATSSGSGAPLTWYQQNTPDQSHGAFTPSEYCEVSTRYGCPGPTPPSGEPVCDGDPLGDGSCVLNPRFVTYPDPNPFDLLAYTSPDYEFLAAIATAAVPFTGTNEVLGIAIFDVPAGAAGTYTIDFVNDPFVLNITGENVNPIPIWYALPGKITISVASCCGYFGPSSDCIVTTQSNCTAQGGTFRPYYEDCSVTCTPCPFPWGCSDGDACTTDFPDCDATGLWGGCGYTVNFDTASLCCNPATGQTASPDDGNPCTIDSCSITAPGSHDGDGRGVPTHTPTNIGAACDAGRCIISSTCQTDGTCQGEDLNTRACASDLECPPPALGCNLGTGFCECSELLEPPLTISTYPHGAPKQRYISFAPDPTHVEMGYLVTDVASGMQYYISTPRTTPVAVSGQGLTFLVSDAAPPLHDWRSLPAIHVGGCMIAPGDVAGLGREYQVTATWDGINFSSPITLVTAARPDPATGRYWADLVGSFAATGDGSTNPPTPAGAWTPPNGLVNGFDIVASVQGFSQPSTLHITWKDVQPETPDRIGAGQDILQVVNAFSAGSTREYYPFAYPSGLSPIHGPNPPSPVLCPTPPLQANLVP